MSFLLSQRKVKIIATLGPSLCEKDHLEQAIQAGVNIFRLNFSHAHHDFYEKVIANIREVTATLKAPCAILQDLQGPKIRVKQVQGEKMTLKKGQLVQLSYDFEFCQGSQIGVDLDVFAQVCRPKSKVFIDDGLMGLEVLSVNKGVVECQVMEGGVLTSRKGINLPGASLPVSCLTPKDLEDLQFGLDRDVDYVALSFVRKKSDVEELRQLIQKHPKSERVKIISKIECLEALDSLEQIIASSDGVMVARGDLAVEVGHAMLPSIQKNIINLCNEAHVPVITATQMLDSMADNPRPTRAEVTDVANAVMDGSDAVMLSRETSTGKYPFRCIFTMHNIMKEVQHSSEGIYDYLSLDQDTMEGYQSVGAAACIMALKLDVKLIVSLSTSGLTASYMSGFRPRLPIVAVTHNPKTLTALSLVWGVHTILIDAYNNFVEMSEQLENALLAHDFVKKGDKVALTLGYPVYQKGATNGVQLYEIQKDKTEVPKKYFQKLSYRFINEAKLR